MADWQSVKNPPSEFVSVLCQHHEDLYPVVAFRSTDVDGTDTWWLEREGPEDTYDRRPGKLSPLYRSPTHWMPLPEEPHAAD